jgi:hypothetical protein
MMATGEDTTDDGEASKGEGGGGRGKMPLGEGVARAMECDDARSPRPYTTINLTKQPLGDATGSGENKRGRQGKGGGEGGGGASDGEEGRG